MFTLVNPPSASTTNAGADTNGAEVLLLENSYFEPVKMCRVEAVLVVGWGDCASGRTSYRNVWPRLFTLVLDMDLDKDTDEEAPRAEVTGPEN